MTNTNVDTESADPSDLSLVELRELRRTLQNEDDVVSYVRRVAQARLDLVESELSRRDTDGTQDISGQIGRVLSQQLTGGPARPPRPTAENLSDNPLADEFDSICALHHFGRLSELDEEELSTLAVAISAFERRVSQDRRERFDRLDALSAELVRRYRDGEASIDSLHTD